MSAVARRALISGRVQGVAYRAWTVEEARALGLSGWVRNLPDGRVELVAEGPEDAVEALLDACREGPPAARVTRIETSEAAPERVSGFEIRRS